MWPRFGVRSLLLVTTVVAIAVAAINPVRNYMKRREQQRALDVYFSIVRPQLDLKHNTFQPAD